MNRKLKIWVTSHKMGQELKGLEHPYCCHGVDFDDLKEVKYEAIGDRIEATTYIMAGLAASRPDS